MYYLLLFLLASAGMTIIVTKSSLFEPIREFFNISDVYKDIDRAYHEPSVLDKPIAMVYKLISCPLCFGFWAGIFVYCLMYDVYSFKMILCHAFASSITSFVIWKYIERS